MEGVLSARIDGLGHRLEAMLACGAARCVQGRAAHTRTPVFPASPPSLPLPGSRWPPPGSDHPVYPTL